MKGRIPPPLRAITALVIATFGLPVILGRSWFPLPSTPFTPTDGPRHIPAFDNFSFSHVEWPWRVVEVEQLRHGTLPMWNPLSSLGLPLPAQYQNQLFLPLEWLEMFGGHLTWNLLLLLKIVLAGLGAYVFVRAGVSNNMAATAAAFCYGFSAYFLWFHAVTGFVNAAVLVPWVFVALSNLTEAPGASRVRCALATLAIAALFLSGQPQIAVLTLMAALLYVLVVAILCGRPLRLAAVIGRLTLTVVFGLLIAAVQLWAFLQALRVGYTLHEADRYVGAVTSRANFAFSLWPFLMGQLMQPWDPSLFPSVVNSEAFPVVVGAFALFFLVAGVVLRPSRTDFLARPPSCRIIGALCLLAVIAAVLASGAFGTGALWWVSPLTRINFPRYIGPVLALMIATIVAWGVSRTTAIRGAALVVINGLAAVVVGGAAKIVAPYIAHPGPSVDGHYFAASLCLGIVPFVAVFASVNAIIVLLARGTVGVGRSQAALLVCFAAELMFFVRYGFGLREELFRLGILALVLGAAFCIACSALWFGTVLSCLAVIVTFVLIAMAPNTLPPMWDPYKGPLPPHLRFLRDQVGQDGRWGRVLGAQGALTPNVATAFGIPELAALAPVQLESTAMYLLNSLAVQRPYYIMPNAWPGLMSAADYPSWNDYFLRRRYYNAVATRFLVDRHGGWMKDHHHDAVRLVYEDSLVDIYEDLDSFPRAYAVGAVEITRYGSDRVELVARLERPGIVILSDSYYPEWVVEVDGQQREMFRANGVVRAVTVDAGRHTIVFEYRPTSLWAWAIVSGLGALAAILLLVVRPRSAV